MPSHREYLGVSLVLGVAAGASFYWWRRRRQQRQNQDWNSKSLQDLDREKCGEESPLLPNTKRSRGGQVANVVSKWEYQQEAGANNASKSTNKSSKVAPVPETKTVQRCPVCRKTFAPSSSESSSVLFGDQRIHVACFQCCDCRASLQRYPAEMVHQYKANVRIKVRCPPCSSHKMQNKDVIQHKIGRVIIGPDEQGNTQQAMEQIGDDLTEAVYFMHPKCAVCGGDFFSPKKTMAEQKRRGNWRYHPVCWDTGKSAVPVEEMNAYRKLSPAHSAKYLPSQIILQLKDNNAATTNRILTTLYFVWEDQETQWKQLRQEKKNNDTSAVMIPYSLDEQAPANPNYVPASLRSITTISTADSSSSERSNEQQQQHKNSNKRQRRQQHQPELLELPSIEYLQLKLLASDEVAPHPPYVVEPISIIYLKGTASDGVEVQDENNDIDDELQAPSPSFFCAKLGFLKFGLHYTLTLNIPIDDGVGSSPNTSPTDDSAVVATEEDNNTLVANLVSAKLSVTIQE